MAKDQKTGKDRLKPHFKKIEYDLKQIQPDAVWPGILNSDSSWAFVRNSDVRESMREFYKNYGPWLSKAKKLQKHVLENFNSKKQHDLFVQEILECLPPYIIEDDQFSSINKEIEEKNILNEIVEV